MRERVRAACPCVQMFVKIPLRARRAPITRLPRTLPSLSDAASDMLSAREHARLDMPSVRFVPQGRNFRWHQNKNPSSVALEPNDYSQVDIFQTWDCGTYPSTVGPKRARSQRTGETKSDPYSGRNLSCIARSTSLAGLTSTLRVT